MAYPYSTKDLLDSPERYSFPDVTAKNYLDTFIYSRLQFLKQIPVELSENSKGGTLSEEDVWDKIRIFEVNKIFYPINNQYDKIKNVKELVEFAMNIVTMLISDFDYGLFSCLLKVHDTLTSLSIKLFEKQQLEILLFTIKVEGKLLKKVINEQNI